MPATATWRMSLHASYELMQPELEFRGTRRYLPEQGDVLTPLAQVRERIAALPRGSAAEAS